MSLAMVAITLAGLLVILLVSGMPVAFGLATLSLGGFYFLGGTRGLLVADGIPWSAGFSYTLLAIPLFVLMGYILERSGIFVDIFRLLAAWLGALPGALGVATMFLCGAFASVVGSGTASCASMTSICYPVLERNGYRRSFATGILASGSGLGPVIPPSGFLILFGVLAETSVSKLFLAVVIPGILLMLLSSIYIVVRVSLHPELAPKPPSATWGERFRLLGWVLPLIVLVFLVLGSIYGGWATPTEAAGIGVVGALVISVAMGRLTLSSLAGALRESTLTSGFILLITIFSKMFGTLLVFGGLSNWILDFLTRLHLTAGWFVAVLIVLFVIGGCFMDGVSMVVLTVPVLLPVFHALDINLTWLGVLMVLLIEIGTMTPPFGLHIFIVQQTTKTPYAEVAVATLPFVALWLLMVALIGFFPGIGLGM